MERAVEKQNIFSQIIVWWISETPRKIISAWKNFLRFNFNYFSVGVLLRTLFSPWRRYEVYRGRGFNVGKYIEAFISNLIFRLLGAFLRSILILAGLVAEIFVALAGAATFLFWIFLPFIAVGSFFFGVRLLI
jgi:hypothetical protein